MGKCQICGAKNFVNWDAYDEHHKRAHNVTMESGVPRLDFTELLQTPVKDYVKMDEVTKRNVVEAFESKLRADAWFAKKLNMLIGTSKVSSEPVWTILPNGEPEVV